MSQTLEVLGRGLIGDLFEAVRFVLQPDCADADRPQDADAPLDLNDDQRLLERAMHLLATHEHSDTMHAARLFDRVVQTDPRADCAHIGLACVADRLGQPVRAAQHLDDALAAGCDHGVILFARGVIGEKQGRPDEAVEFYRRAVQRCPGLRNARERLAAIAFLNDDPQRAIPEYRLLSAARPDDLQTRLLLAAIHLLGDDHQAAIDEYEASLTIEADSWQAPSEEALAYEKEGQLDEAVICLQQIIESQPDCPDTHLKLGDIYARMGRHDEAMEQYASAVELHPGFLEGNVKMGTHFLRLGRYGDAARWFNRAVEINDTLLTAYVGLGVSLQRAGFAHEAEESFEMAGSIEPNSSLLFSEAARLGLKSALLEKAAGLDQRADADLGAMARLSVETRTVDDVMDLIDTIIDRVRITLGRCPNHAELHYRLGLLLQSRNRLDEAIISFQQAVAIYPQFSKALIKLGLALRESGRVEAGNAVLAGAFRSDRQSVELHYALALRFAQQPQFDYWCASYEDACGDDAETLAPRANLNLALTNVGLIESRDLLSMLTAGRPAQRRWSSHGHSRRDPE